MTKREGLKKKDKPKSTALFDVIKDIKLHKQGNLLDVEGSEYDSAYNTYIGMKMISMNNDLCPLVNMVNHLQDSLDKKDMYKLLIELIPPTDSYDGFTKSTPKKYEYENDVTEYYQCSVREAREYIDIMGEEWAKEVHNSFGGQI